MNRFKSFVMVTLLATTSVVCLSQNANAIDLSPFINDNRGPENNQSNQDPANDENNQDPANDKNNQDRANDKNNQDRANDKNNQDRANDQNIPDRANDQNIPDRANDQNIPDRANDQNIQASSYSFTRAHFHYPHHYRRIQRRQTDRHPRHIEQRRGPTRPQPHKR